MTEEAHQASSTMETSRTLTDKETPVGRETPSLSNVEKTSPNFHESTCSSPLDVEITYPEGGRDAWLVVLGAWCGLTSSLGIYNTSGVFEVVMSKVILPDASSSTVGWIFSVFAFMNWVCGVQVGPTFDAMGPRALMTAGTICTLIGMFALSVCTGELVSLNPRNDTKATFLMTKQNTTRFFCHFRSLPELVPPFS